MLKCFNSLNTFLLILLVSASTVYAQTKTIAYKDVILDGKPAKLNVATGEIIVVNRFSEVDAPTAKEEVNVSVENEAKPSDYYIVKDDETLLDLSRRYNTSLTLLKKANNLETTLINKGQKLRVKNLEAHLSTQMDTINSAKLKTETSTLYFHTVKQGETLYSLASQFNMTLDELKRINDLDSSLIKLGQRLRVVNNELDNFENEGTIWIVSKGDTLYSIAKKTRVTIESLKRLNGLSDNYIQIGQELRLK